MPSELYYDPFDYAIDDDPYPVWARMRDEAPLYHNEKYDFYALSRYADIVRALPDWRNYRSGHGTTADILFSGIEVPPGILLFEDPPLHDLHRRLLSRVFTPKRMLAVEDMVREFCCRALDSLRDVDRFDVVSNFGAILAMRTIGYLLGLPEEGQQAIRDRNDALITVAQPSGGVDEVSPTIFEDSIAMFADYIAWRADHPSDDLMTDLLNAEIEEPGGTLRRLDRNEVLAYTAMVAGAGNETSARLIGSMAQLLAEHPDQRRELVADRSLIPSAVEETLRFEPPSPVQARYVAADVQWYGQNVPAGSYLLLLNGSANRDAAQFADPDRYDIDRQVVGHLSFGQGIHFCLGSALARLEARVAFEELLTRWPEWEVDYAGAERARTSSVRGWAKLPVRTR